MFNSGFSMLIPTNIKEHVDKLKFATVPSDYTLHICDTTTLLFEGIISMTEQIPMEGYKNSVVTIIQNKRLFSFSLLVGCLAAFVGDFTLLPKEPKEGEESS